jgi:glutamine amidotransferase
MCRLVAYTGPPTPVGPLVFDGEHSLYRQSWAPGELLSGSVNADGYGVVWWPTLGDQDPQQLRRAEPIWYDPDLRSLLDGQAGSVVQATLRNATPGLPVDRTGVLPLVLEGRAFSLNGWVPDFRTRHMRALRAGLSDARYASLLGVSDAETLFLLVLDELDRGCEPGVALRNVADRVQCRLSPHESAPLTLVLSSRTGVETLHTSLGGGPCNSLYLAEGTSIAPHGTVLASEPLDRSGRWDPVPPFCRVVQTVDGRVSVIPR